MFIALATSVSTLLTDERSLIIPRVNDRLNINTCPDTISRFHSARSLQLNCNLDSLMEKHFRTGDDIDDLLLGKMIAFKTKQNGCKQPANRRSGAHRCSKCRRYRAEGYPARNGLYMGGILARWHDRASVQAMCELWWDEYRRKDRDATN